MVVELPNTLDEVDQSAETLTAVVQDLMATRAEPRNVVLDGLIAGLPGTFQFDTTKSFDAALAELFADSSGAAKSKLIRLATRCGTSALDAYAKEIIDSLLGTIADKEADDVRRAAAAEELIGFRSNDADAVAAVVQQLNAQTAPELGVSLLKAVQGSRAPSAGEPIVAAMPTLTPQLKTVAIGTLLSRPDWTRSLLTAIESRDVELTDLSLDQKQSLRAFPDDSIRRKAEELLAMGGGLPDANRDKVLKALLHLCEVEGSVDAGREIFKKHCSKCHKHGDIGDKNIGPNLTGMSVHPKEELLTHIIDPSRSVEGNFRIYTVVDVDGRVMNGMLAAETRTSIRLVDTEAKEKVIAREDIEELVASRKSLMPEGFEKQMTEPELTDLLEFLTNKGKYVPIPFDKYATAISTKGLFHSGDNGPDRMIFPDWKPKMFKDIPFVLTDPQGKSKLNIIMLNGPLGPVPPKMPKSVSLPCNTSAKAIHILGGVGGWSWPAHGEKSTSVTVRLNYEDGVTEDHPLINGEHFADYIRRVDVPKSEFVMMLRGQQVRYLSVLPKRTEKITTLELIKGDDPTAPMFAAVTIER